MLFACDPVRQAGLLNIKEGEETGCAGGWVSQKRSVLFRYVNLVHGRRGRRKDAAALQPSRDNRTRSCKTLINQNVHVCIISTFLHYVSYHLHIKCIWADFHVGGRTRCEWCDSWTAKQETTVQDCVQNLLPWNRRVCLMRPRDAFQPHLWQQNRLLNRSRDNFQPCSADPEPGRTKHDLHLTKSVFCRVRNLELRWTLFRA